MSRTILIECSPRRPSDGVVVPVRLVFKSIERANFFNAQWHPAVVSVPAFESSLGFDGRSFGAAPSPQIGELVFALTQATRFAASLVWTNAAIVVRHAAWPATGRDAADGDFATIWTGLAEDIATGDGQARVRLLDNGQALRVPALSAKFGSTGDALLDSADALKDRSAETRVPRAWGKLLSIPALLVDRANNIWLFAGNAATSVQAFYDGGAAFTLGTARASLAALQANIPASGAVDYCLDAGGKFLARPWTPPTYPFTAAATFGSTSAASIASAIVTGRTAVAFTAGTVSAFNALQGAECGIYLDDDTSVAAALDRVFSGLGAWWRLSSAGTITLGRWAWATPALTIPAHRRHRPDRLRMLAPTRRRSLGYARNDRVHSESEIARIITDAAYADGTLIDTLRPVSAGATRNQQGGNRIPSPVQLDDFWTSPGVAVVDRPSGGATPNGAIDRVRMLFSFAGTAGWTNPNTAAGLAPFEAKPGEPVIAYARVNRLSGAAGSVRLRVNFYNADLGNFFSVTLASWSGAPGVVTIGGSYVCPAGTAFAWPYIETDSGNYWAAEGWCSNAEPGADVTATVLANDATVIGTTDPITVGDLINAATTASESPVAPKTITALGASAALDVVIKAGRSRSFSAEVWFNLTAGSIITLSTPLEYRIGTGAWSGFGSGGGDTDTAVAVLFASATGTLTNTGGDDLNYQVRAVPAAPGGTGTVDASRSKVRAS